MTAPAKCSQAGTTELLPCPFCGGANIKALAHLDWVACDDCGASLEDAEPSARELWNRRALLRDEITPSVVEVASVIHDARFGPDYPVNLRNSFETETSSGRAYCIKLARAVLDGFRLSHVEASPLSSTNHSPPLVRGSHNSGEADPSVMPDSGGGETAVSTSLNPSKGE